MPSFFVVLKTEGYVSVLSENVSILSEDFQSCLKSFQSCLKIEKSVCSDVVQTFFFCIFAKTNTETK